MKESQGEPPAWISNVWCGLCFTREFLPEFYYLFFLLVWPALEGRGYVSGVMAGELFGLVTVESKGIKKIYEMVASLFFA